MKNQTSAIEQLDRYIRARYPVITILSHEESRVMASIGAVAERRMRRVVTWTCTQGLQQVRPEGEFSDWRPDSDLQFDADMTRNEIAALEVIFTTEIADEAMPVLFVIKDIHGFLGTDQRGFDPQITRWIRDIAPRFSSGRNRTRTCDHICVRANEAMSMVSTPYIWWYHPQAV